MGNLPPGIGNNEFIFEPIEFVGDPRAKLSWGVASGGDIRLALISNLFVDSIALDRLTPEMIVLMEEDV